MDAKAKTMACDRECTPEKLSLKTIEAAITAYYDSLSDAEVEEDRAWGEFAEASLALKDDEMIVSCAEQRPRTGDT